MTIRQNPYGLEKYMVTTRTRTVWILRKVHRAH